MVFDLPVTFDEVVAEVVSAEHGAEAISALVSAAAASGLSLSAADLEQLLGQDSPFDAVTRLDETELAGRADARPTWGESCTNSTTGHTCCWHCY